MHGWPAAAPLTHGVASHIAPDLLSAADEALARGSKSFCTVSKLFDSVTRQSVVLLYAWCRHCDDVVDGQQDGHGQSIQDATVAHRRVQGLIDTTQQVLCGGPPPSMPFEALAEVVRRHRIPHRFPMEHLSGYCMDVDGRHYDSIADTFDYSYRVAGVVGVMMAMVMGQRDDATLDRAADLGLAFQLSNIARDVIDDHAVGRLYLPAQWLAAEGINADSMAWRCNRAALARVTRRLVDAAEPYYRSAQLGLDHLPLRSAWAVSAARGVYRDIGLQVAARGSSAWDSRACTSRRRKLGHVLASAFTAVANKAGLRRGLGMTTPRDSLWRRPAQGGGA